MELFMMMFFLLSLGGFVYMYHIFRGLKKEVEHLHQKLTDGEVGSDSESVVYDPTKQEIFEGRNLWDKLYGDK